MFPLKQAYQQQEMVTQAYMQDFKHRLRQAFRDARMGYVKYPWIYL